jgi:hypothetical protein
VYNMAVHWCDIIAQNKNASTEEESKCTNGVFMCNYHLRGSQDSVVGITTCYGLDDLGFKPQGGKIFCTRPDWH